MNTDRHMNTTLELRYERCPKCGEKYCTDTQLHSCDPTSPRAASSLPENGDMPDHIVDADKMVGGAFDAAGISSFMLRRIYRELNEGIRQFNHRSGLQSGKLLIAVELEQHEAERLRNMIERALDPASLPTPKQGDTNG